MALTMKIINLTCVQVLTREIDGIAGCDHITTMISEYLDNSAEWTIARAAGAGHIGLLERLGKQQAEINTRELEWAMRTAADRGDLSVIQWLTAYRPKMEISKRIMDSAAFRGHLHIVEWLHNNRSEGCTTHAMDSAAACGHLDVVKWLHANRTEGCTTAAMDSAAAGGHLKTVQWLHTNRGEGCTTVATSFAFLNGHLHVLKWFNEQRRNPRAYTDGDDQDAEDDSLWLQSSRRERRVSITMEQTAPRTGRPRLASMLRESRA